VKLNYLLVFIPIALLLDWFGANPVLVFAAATLATIPLAGIMAVATESLAVYLGPAFGGLLNASLGNAPEIIIGLVGFAERLAPRREGDVHRVDSGQYGAGTWAGDDCRRPAARLSEV
jgi:Ca2+/H+ antiporter